MKNVPGGGHVRFVEKVIKHVDEGEALVEQHWSADVAEELQVLGEEADVE